MQPGFYNKLINHRVPLSVTLSGLLIMKLGLVQSVCPPEQNNDMGLM